MTGRILLLSVVAFVFVLTSSFTAAADRPEPVKSVTFGPQGQWIVNGKPFLPIMSWAQGVKNYPMLRGCGINTFCGGGSRDELENCDAAWAAGGYRIADFEPKAAGKPALLAWIQGDEPDMPQNVQDVNVIAASGLIVNAKNPLERMFDTQTQRAAVLDPLNGASFSIMLKNAVTLSSLKVTLGDRSGAAVSQIKSLSVLGDGQPLAAAQRGETDGTVLEITLPNPTTVQELTFKVASVYPGEEPYGLIAEIEGFGPNSQDNLLAAPVRREPRRSAEHLAEIYRRVKDARTGRPVLMTFTSSFMAEDGRYNDAQRKRIYPEYAKYCDVVGFDIYPIYGWNRPEWLIRVASGVSQLREYAGPAKPVYAWIESSKGSKWITYENQKNVEPRHTRGEVWMALIRGATAIGYFTHAWRPTFTEFAPTDDMRAELTRLNAQLTRLAPILLAAPAETAVSVASDNGAEMHAKATNPADGVLYIFAQNIDMKDRPCQAVITVAGLAKGATIEVVDENRTLTAEDGRFVDDFQPLAEHIYRIKQ